MSKKITLASDSTKYLTVLESIDLLKNKIAYHELEVDNLKPKLIDMLKDNLKGFETMLEHHQKIEMVRDEAYKLVNDVVRELEKCNMDHKSRLFRFDNIDIAKNLLSVMKEDEYIGLSDLNLPLVKIEVLPVEPGEEVVVH